MERAVVLVFRLLDVDGAAAVSLGGYVGKGAVDPHVVRERRFAASVAANGRLIVLSFPAARGIKVAVGLRDDELALFARGADAKDDGQRDDGDQQHERAGRVPDGAIVDHALRDRLRALYDARRGRGRGRGRGGNGGRRGRRRDRGHLRARRRLRGGRRRGDDDGQLLRIGADRGIAAKARAHVDLRHVLTGLIFHGKVVDAVAGVLRGHVHLDGIDVQRQVLRGDLAGGDLDAAAHRDRRALRIGDAGVCEGEFQHGGRRRRRRDEREALHARGKLLALGLYLHVQLAKARILRGVGRGKLILAGVEGRYLRAFTQSAVDIDAQARGVDGALHVDDARDLDGLAGDEEDLGPGVVQFNGEHGRGRDRGRGRGRGDDHRQALDARGDVLAGDLRLYDQFGGVAGDEALGGKGKAGAVAHQRGQPPGLAIDGDGKIVAIHFALLDDDRAGDGRAAILRVGHALRIQLQRDLGNDLGRGHGRGRGHVFPVDVLLQLIADEEGAVLRLKAHLEGAGLDKTGAPLRVDQGRAQHDGAAQHIAYIAKRLGVLLRGDDKAVAAGGLREADEALLVDGLVVHADAVERHLRGGHFVVDALLGKGGHLAHGIVLAVGEDDDGAAPAALRRQTHRGDRAAVEGGIVVRAVELLDRLVELHAIAAVDHALRHHRAEGEDGGGVVRAEIVHEGRQRLAHVLHHGVGHRQGDVDAEDVVDALRLRVKRLHAVDRERHPVHGDVELLPGIAARHRLAGGVGKADVHGQLVVALLHLIELDGTDRAGGETDRHKRRQGKYERCGHDQHSFHRQTSPHAYFFGGAPPFCSHRSAPETSRGSASGAGRSPRPSIPVAHIRWSPRRGARRPR